VTLRPVPLDEYPVHQVPPSMRRVATGDRSAYDRCIVHVFDHDGHALLVAGLGVYPNTGVIDAYATLRVGDTLHAVRASDALGDDRMKLRVGPLRIEAVEPLRALRLVREGDGTPDGPSTSPGRPSSPPCGSRTTWAAPATGSPSKGGASSRRAARAA
jgi:hypothetical protein